MARGVVTRGLPEGYEGERIPCVRAEPMFGSHPMLNRRETPVGLDPWYDEQPWPGMRVYRLVQGGRELVGCTVDLRCRGHNWVYADEPFSMPHPAHTSRIVTKPWRALDSLYAYEAHTLTVAAYLLSRGEELRQAWDERASRPRGRLAGRAPEPIAADDAAAMADLS